MAGAGLALQHRHQRPRHLEGADDVDAVDPVELGGVEPVEVLGGDELGRAGVVHQHVGAAEPGFDLGGEAAAIGIERDIGLDHERIGPGGETFLGHGLGRPDLARIVDDDVPAVLRIEARRRRADARRRAGDDADLASAGHHSTFAPESFTTLAHFAISARW